MQVSGHSEAGRQSLQYLHVQRVHSHCIEGQQSTEDCILDARVNQSYFVSESVVGVGDFE